MSDPGPPTTEVTIHDWVPTGHETLACQFVVRRFENGVEVCGRPPSDVLHHGLLIDGIRRGAHLHDMYDAADGQLGNAWHRLRRKVDAMAKENRHAWTEAPTTWFYRLSGPTGNPPQWDAEVWRFKKRSSERVVLRSRHRFPAHTSELQAIESLIEVVDEYHAGRKAKGKKP